MRYYDYRQIKHLYTYESEVDQNEFFNISSIFYNLLEVPPKTYRNLDYFINLIEYMMSQIESWKERPLYELANLTKYGLNPSLFNQKVDIRKIRNSINPIEKAAHMFKLAYEKGYYPIYAAIWETCAEILKDMSDTLLFRAAPIARGIYELSLYLNTEGLKDDLCLIFDVDTFESILPKIRKYSGLPEKYMHRIFNSYFNIARIQADIKEVMANALDEWLLFYK